MITNPASTAAPRNYVLENYIPKQRSERERTQCLESQARQLQIENAVLKEQAAEAIARLQRSRANHNGEA